MTLPPFITNFTRCISVMSVSGSPDTAMMSAYLPFSTEPIRSFQPSASALTIVAALKRARRREAAALHERLEVERLRAVHVR